ncbi:hypothetical protein, partial [uncultured Muribaculum sp.]|uniref:hypothetical protein n=1 Tax=uncultured Muribaculum sp. TaxID=1918613 RepID=UPI00259A698C
FFKPPNFFGEIFVFTFKTAARRRCFSKASAKVETFCETSKYFCDFFDDFLKENLSSIENQGVKQSL